MILDEIVKVRSSQLERERSAASLEEIVKQAEKTSPPPSFKEALKQNGLSLICEVKKASPSKGLIAPDFNPLKTAETYEAAGAAAISCLTEEHYFQGSNDYLKEISSKVKIPVLRKDFITDRYQIYHAKVLGASAVLLIAAILPKNTLSEFLKITHDIGLCALVEVHNKNELDSALSTGAEIIGVNNRDLKTFNVTLETSRELFSSIPEDKVRVSESGIKTHEDLVFLRSLGADAVLIGEMLMRAGNIKATFDSLTEGLR